MVIEAEIIGGPRDGQIVAIEDGRDFHVPVLINPDAFFNEDPMHDAAVIKAVTMRPVLTRNGYRLYWREPT